MFWERRGHPQTGILTRGQRKDNEQWGDGFLNCWSSLGRGCSVRVRLAQTFPRVLETGTLRMQPALQSVPCCFLLPELTEVYFLVLQRPRFFLPSSNVVYLISCRVGNYVQNLCDPLSVVSYACSDKHMPQGLKIISSMCCCWLLIKIGCKKTLFSGVKNRHLYQIIFLAFFPRRCSLFKLGRLSL